jgi:hypothetical protein
VHNPQDVAVMRTQVSAAAGLHFSLLTLHAGMTAFDKIFYVPLFDFCVNVFHISVRACRRSLSFCADTTAWPACKSRDGHLLSHKSGIHTTFLSIFKKIYHQSRQM